MGATTYPLTPKQLRLLLAWAGEMDKTGRNRAIILFASHCAMRIGDVLRLRYEDVFHSEENRTLRFKEYVKVKQGKTGKMFTFKVQDSIRGEIKEYVRRNKIKTGMPLFPSHKDTKGMRPVDRTNVWRIFQQYNRDTKSHISPHSLRKTFGRVLIDNSKNPKFDIVKLMEWYGHTKQSTTLRYIGLLREELDEMQDAVARMYEIPQINARED
jgi:integrase